MVVFFGRLLLASETNHDDDDVFCKRKPDYMNLPSVQAAIHARPTAWHMCSPVVNYRFVRRRRRRRRRATARRCSYADVLSSVLPSYAYLITQKADILVYSGDVDGIGECAARTDRQSPLAVRGAGHEVPFTQPKRARAHAWYAELSDHAPSRPA